MLVHLSALYSTPVFFNLFAAAEPLTNVDVAYGTPGPSLVKQVRGPMENLGAWLL